MPPCKLCGKKKSRIATLISSEGREWLKTASNELFMEGVKPMSGPLAVEIVLHPPNRRRIDVDNRQKPLLDALKRRPKDDNQRAWLFADDDSQVEKLSTEKSSIIPGGKCIVKVTKLPVDQKAFGFMQED
jgi:crossover junction endodeoxyribonuclease RusA